MNIKINSRNSGDKEGWFQRRCGSHDGRQQTWLHSDARLTRSSETFCIRSYVTSFAPSGERRLLSPGNAWRVLKRHTNSKRLRR